MLNYIKPNDWFKIQGNQWKIITLSLHTHAKINTIYE
jgi:hypothetical protein